MKECSSVIVDQKLEYRFPNTGGNVVLHKSFSLSFTFNKDKNTYPSIISISYSHNQKSLFWKKNDIVCRQYGPCIVDIVSNGILYTWSFDDTIITEIRHWLSENNIVLSKNNYFEIPNEHKAEFKLLFL